MFEKNEWSILNYALNFDLCSYQQEQEIMFYSVKNLSMFTSIR